MKYQKHNFNEMLRRYNRYCRKLQRLQATGKNQHRQGVLKKHIERLFQKLNELYISIKAATAVGALTIFCMTATPEANAQISFAPVVADPFSLTDLGDYSNPTFADPGQ